MLYFHYRKLYLPSHIHLLQYGKWLFQENMSMKCIPPYQRSAFEFHFYMVKMGFTGQNYLSGRMGKSTICIGENRGADQLRSNCEADQRLCFRYRDSIIYLLSKSKISSLLPSSVTVQPGLCRTWSEPKLLVFSRTGSFIVHFCSKTLIVCTPIIPFCKHVAKVKLVICSVNLTGKRVKGGHGDVTINN